MSKKIHFIGIGGIGISGLARLYVHEGWEVSGTNNDPSPQTLDSLRAQGVAILLDTNELPAADMYVYSDAWLTLNPDILEAARATGKPVLSYFEALATVANEYYLIAVAGTHGKTTTTAMLIDILEEASFDPTAIVGSLRTKTGSNFRSGASKYFVVEADEYMRHFLYFEPDLVVINNVDFDHPDYFADLADVQRAFKELVAKVPESGHVIAPVKDEQVAPVLTEARATVVDYQTTFDISRDLIQPGLHNQLNAAAAAAAAGALDIEAIHIETALKHFIGTKRRFEYRGEIHNAPSL